MRAQAGANTQPNPSIFSKPFYRITEAADFFGISRGNMYNWLQGEEILDAAKPGKKGIKLIPVSTMQRIIDRRKTMFR